MSKGNVGVDRYLGHSINLDAHLAESLSSLLQRGYLASIPTNAGWISSLAGSGAAAQNPFGNYFDTGATANSKALLYCYVSGMNIGSHQDYIDWDRKLYFLFNLMRANSDAEAVARVQIKQTNAEGALAAKGIGLRIDNLALVGESYGTALGVVDLATSLGADYQVVQVVIVHDPGASIKWYIRTTAGGTLTLKGTQSTVANIPSGLAGAGSTLVHSIINGATGGVAARMRVLFPTLWQER